MLDAGCGTGANLARLACSGRSVGLDLSEHALGFCRQRRLVNLIQGDIGRAPFPSESFHGILCSSVLYHRWVGDMGGALREMRRILKPGGFLFLNLPAFDSLSSEHDRAVFTARRFTARTTRALLSENGFEVKHLSYWTALLCPVVYAVRRLGIFQKGRDFNAHEPPSAPLNAILNGLMAFEFMILKAIPFPFGVSIVCVARKRDGV